MVDHLAPSIYATSAWARVYTLQIRACSVSRTVRVRDTLWPAGRVGVSEVSRDAGTAGSTSDTPAIGVCSTRAGLAWIYWRRHHRLDHLRYLVTLLEGVAVISLWALADRQVVPHRAFGVKSARTGARVNAALL